jgi:hypothetical protein
VTMKPEIVLFVIGIAVIVFVALGIYLTSGG